MLLKPCSNIFKKVGLPTLDELKAIFKCRPDYPPPPPQL
jgi:hypothetical protein